MLVVFAASLLSAVLLLGRSYHLLLGLVVAAGWAQASLASYAKSTSMLYLDETFACFLLLAAGLKAVSSRERADHNALLVLSVLTGVVMLAVVRSPDLAVGLQQARQVFLPGALVFAGYVLRSEIRWVAVARFIVVLSGFTVAWVLWEEWRQRPLIDPVWYYTVGIGAPIGSLRDGLPPSYIADGVGGVTVFRPGGPFMNPPVLGFFLALGAYASLVVLRGARRLVALVALAAALYFAYARAGMLMFGVVTAVYLTWSKLGRVPAVLAGVAGGGYMYLTFSLQGNTSGHTEGLLSGVQLALHSPLGLGFGSTGYEAALSGSGSGAGSESLLGLYFAWLGWPMLALVAWLVVRFTRLLRITPRAESLPIWLGVGFGLAAGATESASSMAATPVLWLTLGLVLALPVRKHPWSQGGARWDDPAQRLLLSTDGTAATSFR